MVDITTLVDIGKCQNYERLYTQHLPQLPACILSVIVEHCIKYEVNRIKLKFMQIAKKKFEFIFWKIFEAKIWKKLSIEL